MCINSGSSLASSASIGETKALKKRPLCMDISFLVHEENLTPKKKLRRSPFSEARTGADFHAPGQPIRSRPSPITVPIVKPTTVQRAPESLLLSVTRDLHMHNPDHKRPQEIDEIQHTFAFEGQVFGSQGLDSLTRNSRPQTQAGSSAQDFGGSHQRIETSEEGEEDTMQNSEHILPKAIQIMPRRTTREEQGMPSNKFSLPDSPRPAMQPEAIPSTSQARSAPASQALVQAQPQTQPQVRTFTPTSPLNVQSPICVQRMTGLAYPEEGRQPANEWNLNPRTNENRNTRDRGRALRERRENIPNPRNVVVNQTACDVCGNLFANSDAVKRHKRIRHQGQSTDTVTCEICQGKFRNSQNLERHVSKAHGPDAGHECPDCGARFTGARGLNRHRKEIHGLPSAHERGSSLRSYICDVPGCSYSSDQNCNLKRHNDSVHLKKKNYGCPSCDFRASTKSNLRSHEVIHEREDGDTGNERGRRGRRGGRGGRGM